MSSDLDECDPKNAAENDERPQCQHFCHNYVGGYFCSCRIGYQLQSDRHSCKGKEKILKDQRVPEKEPFMQEGWEKWLRKQRTGLQKAGTAPRCDLSFLPLPQWSAAVSCSQRHLGTWAAPSTPSLIPSSSGVTTASVCRKACLYPSSFWSPLRLMITSKSTVLMTSSRYWDKQTLLLTLLPDLDKNHRDTTVKMRNMESVQVECPGTKDWAPVHLITTVLRTEALAHSPLWVKKRNPILLPV